MAKGYRRKPKRTFRKKRFSRKRRTTRRAPGIKYDGMIKVKLQATKEINNTDGNGVATFAVSWGN